MGKGMIIVSLCETERVSMGLDVESFGGAIM